MEFPIHFSRGPWLVLPVGLTWWHIYVANGDMHITWRNKGERPNVNRQVVWNEVLSGDFIFILQSLTTSKMRKSQTKKLSQFHKAKTCWTENSWSSGIMSNFWGQFFLCFGGQKFFLPLKQKKMPSKVAHISTWPTLFSPTSFYFL